MAKPPPTLRLEGWPAGVNNRAAPFALPAGACRQAVNVDVRQSGKLARRAGYTRLVADAGAHSLYADGSVTLYVAGGQLKQLTDATATVLAADWGDAPTAYVRHGDRVFLSNGVQAACWLNGLRPWGVDRPPDPPDLLALPTGGLAAGVYQVIVTWVSEGIESGASAPGSATVAEGGGILVSGWPEPPAYVDTVRVYLSARDSGEFYLDGDYPARYASSAILEDGQRTVPLTTRFKDVMPAVTRLASQGGRIYGALDNILYYTSPFNPMLMDGVDGVAFESPVTGLVAVTDGLYVLTERATYFVTSPDGEGPPLRRTVAHQGAVPGAVTVDPLAPAGWWLGERGLMRGLPGGQVENLTDAHLALPVAQRGALIVREADGERHALVSTWGCAPNPLVHAEWAARETARKGHAF